MVNTPLACINRSAGPGSLVPKLQSRADRGYDVDPTRQHPAHLEAAETARFETIIKVSRPIAATRNSVQPRRHDASGVIGEGGRHTPCTVLPRRGLDVDNVHPNLRQAQAESAPPNGNGELLDAPERLERTRNGTHPPTRHIQCHHQCRTSTLVDSRDSRSSIETSDTAPPIASPTS